MCGGGGGACPLKDFDHGFRRAKFLPCASWRSTGRRIRVGKNSTLQLVCRSQMRCLHHVPASTRTHSVCICACACVRVATCTLIYLCTLDPVHPCDRIGNWAPKEKQRQIVPQRNTISLRFCACSKILSV